MSRTIDEKVVSMQFDNAQFERNVQTSMGTLNKLKQSLNLTGAAKGLEDVNAAARGFDASPLSNGVETIRAKFSALEVMAVTALANITNSAVNAGKNLVKAFTIDPIKTGFQEYETQINAVQTILANTESKGSTLQDVNRALSELNTYADKTIYNFTEMTRNIGTFTAAGVDLKTSVSAIKGIANLAAVSGSTSQQASTAMYQLSQALASGTVKLMDWNSVVNAGMGGQVFQDALKETARVHGIAIDDMIKSEGSFRETLQKGWLTSDILTETLNHFTMAAEEGTEEWEAYKKSLMDTGYSEEQAAAILKLANTATDAATKVKTFSQLMDTLKESAQSGWTKSWEILIGDFEEAKGFLTDVSDKLGAMIGESADARNEMLSGGLSSGWKQLLDAGIADEEGYKDTFKSIAKEHGVSIDDMIAAEKKLDDSLTDSEAFQKALKTGFKDGKLSADMLTESVHKMADNMSNMSAKELEAAGYTAEYVKQIQDLSAGLKDGSVSMEDFVNKIQRPSGRENIIQALWNSFDGLMNIVTPIKEAFRDMFPATTGEQVYKFTERIRDLTAKFKDLTEKNAPALKSTFKGIFSILKIGVTIVKAIASGIAQLVGKIAGLSGGFLSITGSLGDWISGIAKSITETNLFGKAVDAVVGFLGKAIDAIKEFGSYLKGKFEAPGFESFLNILNTLWTGIKKVGLAIVKVASNIGKALGNAFRNGDMKSLLDLVNGGIITAILLKLKSWISGFKDLAGEGKSLVDTIKDVFGTVGDSLTAWQNNLKVGNIKAIAIAIGILAAALLVLSCIDPEKLGSALSGITVLFLELTVVMKGFDKLAISGKGISKVIPLMLSMSVAVLILAAAVKTLSDLDLGALAKGLVGVGVLLAELVGAAKLMSMGGKKIVKGAYQMILMAAALKIMASVCKDLSELSWEGIAKGVVGIGGLLAVFAGFAELMKLIKPKKMMSSAASLILIGVAMEIFADVCAKLGQLEWGSLGKAGAAIAGILAIAAGFALLAGLSSKMGKSAMALILIGAAMEIFADVCNKFGQMEWGDLGKAGAAIGGILALAAGFALLAGLSSQMFASVACLTIIAVAMEIFADVCNKFSQMNWEELAKAGAAIGGILALAAGFALLAGLAPGMFASSAALLVMAAALTILTPVLTTLGGLSWGEIGKGLLALAGAFLVIGVAGLVLAPIVPALLALSGAIALLGVGCLAAGIGVAAFAAGLMALATLTAAGATAIVSALHIIIVGVLELIPAMIGALTDAVVALCQVFIRSVPAICEAIKVLILELTKVLVECVPTLADGALQMVLGVLDALVMYAPQIVSGLVNLFIGLIDSLAIHLPELVSSMVNFLVLLFDSIASSIAPLIESWGRLFGAIFQGIADILGPIIEGVLAPILEVISNLVIGIVQAIAPYIPIISAAFVQITTVVSNAIVQITQAIAPFIPYIQMIVTSITQAIQTIINAVVAIVQQIVPIINSITALVQQLGNAITQILLGISDVIQAVGGVIAQVFQGIADVISSVGDAIRNSLEGLAEVFDSVFGGIAEVITSVGDSIRTVLDGIAGIIDSIGNAALNAGTGFQRFADGVETITELDLFDMAASMLAVSTAIGGITLQSGKLAAAGEGMKQIADGTKLSAGAFNVMASGIAKVTATLGSIGLIATISMSELKSSIAGSATCFTLLSTAAAASTVKVTASIASMATTCGGAAKTMASAFSVIGRALMDDLANGIRSGASHVKAIMISLLTVLVTVARSRTAQFGSIGRMIMIRFALGVRSGSSAAKRALSVALSSAALTARGYYANFYDAGSYVAQGFANGIKDNRYKAEAQARIMAQNAATAAAKALKINSPSKVFRAIAYSIPEGFAQGINRKSWMGKEAVVSMAKDTLRGTSQTIAKVATLVSDGIDAEPTIRPVLDLSAVSKGASDLNSMLETDPSISLMSNVRSVSSMMNNRQNGTNDDVISAIHDLGKQISKSSGDTYSINGITYSGDSDVSDAIRTLVRAARIEGRT